MRGWFTRRRLLITCKGPKWKRLSVCSAMKGWDEMRRTSALALMMVFSALLSAGQVTAERPDGRDNRNEEMIRSLHSQEVEALLHKDITSLRQIMSDDFVVTN